MNIQIQNNCAYEKETKQDAKSVYMGTEQPDLLRVSLQLESVIRV